MSTARGYTNELTRLDRQCSTGHQCGNSCIPRTKTCRKKASGPVGEQRLKRISELSGGAPAGQPGGDRPAAEQPERGGALATRGGALAVREKDPQQEREPEARRTRTLEDEYRGRELTDADIEEYATRKLKELASPEGMAETDLVRHLADDGMVYDLPRHKGGLDWVLSGPDDEVAAHYREQVLRNRIDIWQTNLPFYERQADKIRADIAKAERSKAKTRDKTLARLRKNLASELESIDKTRRNIAKFEADLKKPDRKLAAEARDTARKIRLRIAKQEAEALKREIRTEGRTQAMAGFLERSANLKETEAVRSGKWAHRYADDAPSYTEAEAQDRIREFLSSEPGRNALGFSRDDRPSRDELRRAYRKAAAKAHPDAGGSETAFRRVQTTYEDLKRKFNYDSSRVRKRRTASNRRRTGR